VESSRLAIDKGGFQLAKTCSDATFVSYLAGFHIESLRTVPATYRPVDADELVIREFEVRKVQF
jgi:hypothetical protein